MAKVTPTTGSAKPNRPAGEKPAKKAPKRGVFEQVGNKDPKVYPFVGRTVEGEAVATPTGFDFTKNTPLKKKDFSKPSLFYLHQAEALEFKAQQTRNRAAEIAKSGEGKGAGKAKRLQKMLESAAKMREELEKQGYDVQALLAGVAQPAAAGTAPAAVNA